MNIPNLSVRISNKLKLKNPVIAASGTFAYVEEYAPLLDINKLGGIVTKTITLEPKIGNEPPRIVETAAGMLNSIGMQNEGVEDFVNNKLPKLRKYRTRIIVSIAGSKIEEYVKLAQILDKQPDIDALEINISCPNVNRKQEVRSKKQEVRLFAQDEDSAYEVVSSVRKVTKLPIITKLSPNVTDIKPIARKVEEAGSDAISLINTVFGMAVDIDKRKPKLGNIFGGLSGPAIKPIALYMVYQVVQIVNIPVIGIGGIMTANDALEFIITGAKAIQVGSANFVNPKTTIEIIAGIKQYLIRNNINDINELMYSSPEKDKKI